MRSEKEKMLSGELYFICPEVRIGAGAVIGAGSVVTRDIPAWVLATGTPCWVVREVGE